MAALGKYELLQELNSGAMGTVYVARDSVLDRKLAVKTILPGATLDAELKERFYREARACARLQHPSIVTIYDFGEENGTAYIAMELLGGTDARRIIQERRPLPLEIKLELGAMVLEGLAHAHAEGIIHRDIKPSNIFVTEDGRAKILDFGIARTAASSLTMVGRVLGTPNYMAPEQILGKPCDARSDIFSAAIVIFELIAYVHPFQGPSIPKRIVREAADPLRSAFPQAPAGVEAMLARALEKEPAKRYASATDFARDLRDAAAAVRIGSRGPGTLPRAVVPEMFAPSTAPPDSGPAKGEGTEVLMDRVLTALQDFDEAVEKQDGVKARRSYEALRKAAGSDERFEGAVQRSQERLHELERTLPPREPEPDLKPEATATAPPPEPEPPEPAYGEATLPMMHPAFIPRPSDPAGTRGTMRDEPAAGPRPNLSATQLFRSELLESISRPQTPAEPESSQETLTPAEPRENSPVLLDSVADEAKAEPGVRLGSPFQGDATSLFSGPSAAPPKPPATPAAWPPAAPAGNDRPPAAPVTHPAPPPLKNVPAQPAPPPVVKPQGAPASSATLILAVGGVVVLLIVAAGVTLLFSRSGNAKLVPAVATAQVMTAQTNIFKGQDAGQSVITAARRGETLNVLRSPHGPAQEWTQVQYVNGRTVHPEGYAKTANLGNWSSPKAGVALSLLKDFGPGEGATESDASAQLAALDSFANRFAGSREVAEARLEMARWNIYLAKSAAGSARPADNYIQAATAELNEASARGDLADQAQQLKQQLDALAGEKPPPPTTPPPPGPKNTPTPDQQAARALQAGQKAYEAGEYATAERNLKWALYLKKDYPEAKQLLERVERARKAEGQ